MNSAQQKARSKALRTRRSRSHRPPAICENRISLRVNRALRTSMDLSGDARVLKTQYPDLIVPESYWEESEKIPRSAPARLKRVDAELTRKKRRLLALSCLSPGRAP